MKFSDDMGTTIAFELDTAESALAGGAQMPIKLGDGNFGCVFAARGSGGPLAFKVIYKHEAEMGSNASDHLDYKESRVRDELEVKKTIYDRLRGSADEEIRSLVRIYENHLALPLAYSDKLDEDTEFAEYAKIYRKYDIEFSKYGYIMERYDCSLKDLMEYGDRTSFLGSADRKPHERRKVPYAGLKSVSLIERERSALPVIQQVAKGLHILHAAGLRHQDIKPANIYYRDNLNSVDFVLGDLGFLHVQNPILAGSALVSPDALAIGTKHYRSVEQIDHSDVSEIVIESTADEDEVTVISRDPKFMRTNIGKGDLVMFPRSRSRTLFEIAAYEVNEDSSEIRMTISSRREAENGKGASLSLRDGLTQAAFIKNPTERTDLFGLGAILFDIISAGDSAERFYEILRKFDVKGIRIQSQILNFYAAWASGQDVDPDISAIFQRVNDRRTTEAVSSVLVHSSVLAFLLNCLMSEPDDSYFTRFFKAENNGKRQGWVAIASNIEALFGELGAHDYDQVEVNVLTTRNSPPSSPYPEPPSLETIGVLLPDLRGGGFTSYRWLRAASFLLAMMGLVRRTLQKITSADEDTAFISLAPEHLVVDFNNHIVKHNEVIGRCTHGEYLSRLMGLDPIFSSVQSQPNSFLPVWWGLRKNRVEVRLLPESHRHAPSSEDAPEHDGVARVDVKYVDYALPSRETKAGDFLVVSNDDSLYSLYDVTESKPGCIGVRRNRDVKDEKNNREVEFRCEEYRRGYVIEQFDFRTYSGGMLAVYLFHSLLAGGDEGEIDHFGREIISKAVYFPMTELRKPSDANSGGLGILRLRRNNKQSGDDLVAYTIRLYVGLMLGGFFRRTRSPRNEMEAIAEEISEWSRRVGEWFGVTDLEDWIFRHPDSSESIAETTISLSRNRLEEIARAYLRSTG